MKGSKKTTYTLELSHTEMELAIAALNTLTTTEIAMVDDMLFTMEELIQDKGEDK